MMHGGGRASEQSLARWHRWEGNGWWREEGARGVTEDGRSHVSSQRFCLTSTKHKLWLCKTILAGIFTLALINLDTQLQTNGALMWLPRLNDLQCSKALCYHKNTSPDWAPGVSEQPIEQPILWSARNVTLMKYQPSPTECVFTLHIRDNEVRDYLINVHGG